MRRVLELIAAAVLVAMLVAGCADDSPDRGATAGTSAPANNDDVAAIGDPAPDVTFERFDGTQGALADYRGMPLVLNFWASWCVPCITEMPEFEAVHRRLGDEVAFLGLNVQDTAEDGRAFADDSGVTWDLGRDPDGTILQRLGGAGMPTTVLIDAEGTIRHVETGDLSGDELESLIDEKLR
ncbi:MAG: TlpA family protein disulfide reductase [Acidimicrobiales bacterium]